MTSDARYNNPRRKEINFDKYKPTKWRTFKKKVAKFFNFKEKGGLWIYLPALILYPLAIAIVAIGIYYTGIKAVPRFESENLQVYSIQRDTEFARDLGEYLDPYATELKEVLDVNFNNTLDVVIYRSMKVYGSKVFELRPRWPQTHSLLVTAEAGNISCISPDSKDMVGLDWYDYEFIKTNAKVSLGQEYLNSVNYSYKSLPIWLSEGVPYYLVADDADLAHIKDVISSTDTPPAALMKMDLLRSNLYSIRTDAYTQADGREYTYAFVDFLVQKYDQQTLIDWVKNKKFNFTHTGYDDYSTFYGEWENFLNENYRN